MSLGVSLVRAAAAVMSLGGGLVCSAAGILCSICIPGTGLRGSLFPGTAFGFAAFAVARLGVGHGQLIALFEDVHAEGVVGCGGGGEDESCDQRGTQGQSPLVAIVHGDFPDGLRIAPGSGTGTALPGAGHWSANGAIPYSRPETVRTRRRPPPDPAMPHGGSTGWAAAVSAGAGRSGG